MGGLLLQAWLTGLSTGLFCTGYCLPFLAPVLVAEARSLTQQCWLVAQFLAGRLVGYLLFGALAGGLGALLDQRWLDRLAWAGVLGMAGLLIVTALGVGPGRWGGCCPRLRRRTPALLGLLTGVNMCPPFWLSLSYVFTLHSVGKAVVYFLAFFAGTSVFFLPFVFLGLLGKLPEFRKAARLGALLAGSAFFIYGLYVLWRAVPARHLTEDDGRDERTVAHPHQPAHRLALLTDRAVVCDFRLRHDQGHRRS